LEADAHLHSVSFIATSASHAIRHHRLGLGEQIHVQQAHLHAQMVVSRRARAKVRSEHYIDGTSPDAAPAATSGHDRSFGFNPMTGRPNEGSACRSRARRRQLSPLQLLCLGHCLGIEHVKPQARLISHRIDLPLALGGIAAQSCRDYALSALVLPPEYVESEFRAAQRW
jgi:hypothetical protein